jgi:Ca-activated chloride channel family protein
VTLQEPLFLLVLLAAPVLALLYVRRERRIRSGHAAFANPALMPAVLPERPGWRRHLPLVAYLLALVVLAVALARPQVAVSVTVDQARILLVTDQSGSMAAQDVLPTRLDAARKAAGDFLQHVPDRVQVGAVAYNQSPRIIASPSRDRVAVRTALAAIKPAGSTATGDALTLAIKAAQQAALPGAKPPPAAIVLLSDGKSVRGSDPLDAARAAAKANIPIYTISLGTADGTIPKSNGTGTVPVPPDPETLRRIAELSHGQSFAVQDASRLSTVYERLGRQLTRKKEHHQITAGFAGGGLALVLMGAGMSLFWFGRVP